MIKKKILIFHPKLEPHKDFHYMPLSALSVASALIAQGLEVKIIDDRLVSNPVDEILAYEADRIMITVYTGYQVTRAYEVSKALKKHNPDISITWGGPHINALPEQTLQSRHVDRILPGYYECGEHRMPWELVNPEDYINPDSKRFIYVSTYSCPGVCTFCSTKNKRQWIELPIKKVQDDIDHLMKMYPYKECVFFDATVFTRPQRVKDLSQIMMKHNLDWIADARAMEIVKSPDILDLVSTGLKQLTIGLESGSDRIVQQMRKGKNHLIEFEECAKIMSKHNMIMASGVIFGCPGEGPEDIKETIKYIRKVKQINPNFRLSTTFFMPLPDTIMADEAKKYGYTEPKTLKKWAVLGQSNHFKYNQWMNNPWIREKDEYKRIYDDFINECNYLI